MVPLISFVGKSNSGKTTLVEKLIPELRRRGYSVGVIKNTSHQIKLDTPGKDTYRFQQAGADATALVTADGFTLFKPMKREDDPEVIAAEHFNDMDMVIVEGFKKSGVPKLEVLGDEGQGLNEEIQDRVAVVADFEVDADVPQFGRDDIKDIGDFIEKNFLTKVSRSEVSLWVNGEFVHMKAFVKAFVGQTVKGMVNSLRGGKKPEKIRLKIGR